MYNLNNLALTIRDGMGGSGCGGDASDEDDPVVLRRIEADLKAGPASSDKQVCFIHQKMG